VNECGYRKGSQNIDQPKNTEEKSLGRASSLIFSAKVLGYFAKKYRLNRRFCFFVN